MDMTNKFGVDVVDGLVRVRTLNSFLVSGISKNYALILSAFLVALADDPVVADRMFDSVVALVRTSLGLPNPS